jgi:hypothetical protein
MLDRPYRVEIGPYWINLPRSSLFIHLDAINDLSDLKVFIDHSTKSNVTTLTVTVNGISGVKQGGYGPPRTWIDWWFRKGDTMICLCLQSKAFPVTEPSEDEIVEHGAIIESLRYCRDFPSEIPPH